MFVENMRNKNENNKNMDAYCDSYKSAKDKQQACKTLSNNNCKSMNCCVLLNDGRCLTGNADGPIFQTDSNGNAVEYDYLYYQNKCYGQNCPI